MNTFRDEMFLSALESYVESSLTFLNKITQSDEPFVQLTFDSFVALDPNTASETYEQDFGNATQISAAELRAQIAYELCEFYLFDKKYDLAKQKASECRENYHIMREEYGRKVGTGQPEVNETFFLFCTFDEEELNGRLMACGLFDKTNTSLIYRMNDTALNNYNAIEQIFIADNAKLDIPLVNRRIMALDMDSECDQQNIGKDKVVRVDALNAVRSYIDPDDLFVSVDFPIKNHHQNGVTHLIEETVAYANTSSTKSGLLVDGLKQLCYDVILTSDTAECKECDLESIKSSGILTQAEIDRLKSQKQLYQSIGSADDRLLSPLCTIADWKLSDEKGKLIPASYVFCRFF